MRKMLATVRWPGARMAPSSSTWACRQVCWRKSGAKHRITAAKRAGRRSMAAVLWRGRPSLAAHPLRRLTLPEMAKPELRLKPSSEAVWVDRVSCAPGRACASSQAKSTGRVAAKDHRHHRTHGAAFRRELVTQQV